MAESDYLAKFNNFYKLKQKYDETNRKSKQKIINNPNLSNSEKSERLKLLKPKCINCKNPVGTIFQDKNRILTAICGATIPTANFKPCDLNIKLEKQNFMTLNNKVSKLKKIKENTEKKILKTKLDLLFNFKSEEETVSFFDELYGFYKKDCENYNETLKTYLNITEHLNEKQEINLTKIQIEETISKFKKLIVESKQNPSKRNQLNKEAIDLYILKILPLLENYNKLVYNFRDIILNKDNNTFHLIEKPFTINDLEVPIEKDSILLTNN